MLVSFVDVLHDAVQVEVHRFTDAGRRRVWRTRCAWPSAQLDPAAYAWGQRIADGKVEELYARLGKNLGPVNIPEVGPSHLACHTPPQG